MNLASGNSPKVAAVFACFNRRETALECVRRLQGQTRQTDQVIIADNHSDDGTREALASLGWERLVVLDTGANLGNAGGIESAMEHAFSVGMDAVWILDDDSWPRPGALEAMLSKPWENKVVRVPLQIDPTSGKFTWPLQVKADDGSWKLATIMEELPPGNFIPTKNNWTGSLVPRTVREKIGPVLGALFIRGEDEEYPRRMEMAGFSQEAVRHAVLDHPGPANIVRWRFFGKSLFYEPGLVDWKLYYKVRNMVWLNRKFSGNAKAIMMAAAYVVAACRIDGANRLPLLARAIRDGWSGRLGKMSGQSPVNPGGKA